MACKHELIKCTNCVKSCIICGEILPADFLPGKTKPKADKAAEAPENDVKSEIEEPVAEVQEEQAEKPAKKQRAKKGDAK